MSTSLESLRQEIGQDLNECFVGTVVTATANNVTCTALIDPDESSSLYDRAWLKMTSGGADGDVRRVRATGDSVTGYDAANGLLQLSRALSAVPASGDSFELHTLIDPDQLDRLINNGLERCVYIDWTTVTVVSSQREYDLSEYTWITRPGQVHDVRWVYGDTANQKRYLPIRWFFVEMDAGSPTLHVDPNELQGDDFVFLAERPYAALSSDSDTTDCPIEWAKAQAIWEVYRWLARTGPAEDVARYQMAQQIAAIRLGRMYRAYTPRLPRRIQFTEGPAAAFSVGAP